MEQKGILKVHTKVKEKWHSKEQGKSQNLEIHRCYYEETRTRERDYYPQN